MKVEVGFIEGSQAMHHISQGWAITVVATVSELGLSNPDTPMIYNHALSALIAQVGDRGSPCPSIYVPTYLEQFIPEIISPDCVKIRIVYRGYPLPVIETSSVLSQVESNIDIYGNPILVIFEIAIYLSDAFTGIGLTATTASGGIAALASTGTILGVLTTSKAIRATTNAAGLFTLVITDTAKTGFYPVAGLLPGMPIQVGAQLTTASYHS